MWNKIFFLSVVASIGVMSATLCAPALPLIAKYFATDFSYIQFTISLFLMGNAFGQLVSGSLSDQIGQRRVMFGGLLLYLAASGACACADRLELLFVARLFQGMGSAVGPVLARAIAASSFPAERSAQVQSYGAMAIGIASMAAVFSSGYLSLLSWRGNFWLAAGLGVLLLLWSRIALKKESIALPPTISLKKCFAQMREILPHPRFLENTFCHSMTQVLMYGYIGLFPFLLIELFQESSPAQVGIYSVYMIAFYMAGTLLAARLVARLGSAFCISAAVSLQLIAGAMLLVSPPFWLFLTALSLFNVSVGVILPLTSAAALAPYAGHSAGAASSALGLCYRAAASLLSALICQFPLAGGRSLGVAMVLLSASSLGIFRWMKNIYPFHLKGIQED